MTITCAKCGHPIQSKALFCPNCGQKVEDLYVLPLRTTRLRQEGDSLITPQPEQASKRQGCGLTLAIVGVALAVVLLIVGVGVAAVYLGMADRAKVERQAAQEHYLKGEAYLREGQWELAVAEFELTLQLDPDHRQVQAKLEEARHELNVQPTPTAMFQQETKEAVFAELELAHRNKDWQRVMTQADKLLALDPSYRRADIDPMLYDTFYQLALALIQENRMTEAISYFDRALTIQPDNAQVTRAKDSAILYMDAMRYWGADWDRAIEQLAKLYQRDPDYKDVRERVISAHVAHGDILGQRGEWCRAEESFTTALQFRSASEILAKQQEAAAACQQTPDSATPGTTVPSGTFVGQVDRIEDAASAQMFIRGKVLDAQGQGVSAMRVRIQAWDFSVFAVTDDIGQYSFDGLANPVTYTLSLPDAPSVPVDALGQWGKISWVYFRQAK